MAGGATPRQEFVPWGGLAATRPGRRGCRAAGVRTPGLRGRGSFPGAPWSGFERGARGGRVRTNPGLVARCEPGARGRSSSVGSRMEFVPWGSMPGVRASGSVAGVWASGSVTGVRGCGCVAGVGARRSVAGVWAWGSVIGKRARRAPGHECEPEAPWLVFSAGVLGWSRLGFSAEITPGHAGSCHGVGGPMPGARELVPRRARAHARVQAGPCVEAHARGRGGGRGRPPRGERIAGTVPREPRRDPRSGTSQLPTTGHPAGHPPVAHHGRPSDTRWSPSTGHPPVARHGTPLDTRRLPSTGYPSTVVHHRAPTVVHRRSPPPPSLPPPLAPSRTSPKGRPVSCPPRR